VTLSFASQVRNRLNGMEVERDEVRMGKGRRVELQDSKRSDRVENSESPAHQQFGALFGRVVA